MSLQYFTLNNKEQTCTLAQCLVHCLLGLKSYPTVLLKGELGAGKTALIREIVRTLPGGDVAEISSPSFNLVNHYPTLPPVSHFDLYRLEQTGLDPDLEEEILSEDRLILVEWGNHLPEHLHPENSLQLALNICPPGREIAIAGSREDLINCIISRALYKGIPYQEENQCT